ncbi:MAG: hypothetical protein LBC90_06875 [Candidatus Adiutrix sp.]|jgi:AMMECR1 domain-containing protein|nr:hypothetical protein [Candidatus Adiutrix sp.]
MAGLLPVFLMLFLAGPAWAQADAAWPKLKGQEKKVLLLIAREALNAAQEGRPSREARVDPRLQVSQPLVLSLYVDDELRARAWRLKGLQPIYLAARDLVQTALSDPKVSAKPLDREEMARAKIGLAVLGRYAPAKDETDIPPRSAVIIYNGFIEWLALPEDVPGGKAADILSYACGQAGLRPQVWLLPTTTIFHAPAEELKE